MLSMGQKAGWGLADMGVNVFVVVKQLLVFTYLTTFLGVPPGAAGVVTFAVLGFDVITDPIVGYWSDRSTSRWGRRMPWIALGALILAAGIVAMFAVPQGMGWQANALWVTAFFALASIGFTFVTIPYGAMAGEMTQDPTERSTMMAFRMTFASLGLLIAGALVPALAGDTREGYARAVLLVAPVIVLTIWGMLFATRRAPTIPTPATQGFVSVLRLVLENRPFAILTLLYGVFTLGVALIAAGLQLSALYLVTDDGTGALSGLAGALGIFSTLFAMFIVGSVISQPIWVLASRRFGKTTALALGMLAYIAVLLGIRAVLPAPTLGPLAGLFLLAGMTNGAYQQVPWAMYPDLMDVTRRRSGTAIEGAFSAVWLFGQKVANALAPLLLGLILSVAGWRASDSGVVDQTPQALATLEIALTLVPAAIFALGIVALWTLYRPRVRDIASHR
ncbi:glycoside/pentoside/hexuronide:cation symporter, GPH family [Loktanella sp. DSM 29012]|uniref:MFS transporter n=1 Tax=Loktanella sp. DSM 29012 TaxID=1881056 RepID=UPI0008BAA8BC|nr:MFS transporter [Loktanella sp. DSM 29012]SEP99803.1 glycoside/pentoside/hexuronide:cation symporter, GPH family [Loktanella sp. DSM 29012]